MAIQRIGHEYCCMVCQKQFGLKFNALKHVLKFHRKPKKAAELVELHDEGLSGLEIESVDLESEGETDSEDEDAP